MSAKTARPLSVADATSNVPPAIPPEAAAEPSSEAAKPGMLKIQRLRAQLAAAEAAQYAKDHPVKAAGIVTGAAFAGYGLYRLIRDITG